MVKNYYQEAKEKFGEEEYKAIRRARGAKHRSDRQVDYLFYEAKSRAKKANMEFNLEKSDIVIPDVCPVFGIEIKKNVGKRFPWDHSPTLDRVDNNKGYTKDNVRIISWKANRAKGDHTIEEFKSIIAYMENHLKKE